MVMEFNFISAPTSPSRASEFYREFDDFSIFNQISSHTPNHEFAFHVGNDRASKSPVSADELFDRGIIRSPLAYGVGKSEPSISIKSPLIGSPKSNGRKSFWSALTPKRKKQNHSNPYVAVTEDHSTLERGRPPHPSTSVPGRRVARSFSPVRDPPTTLSIPTTSSKSRKWRLKNFLLFRSASEGHASHKDPMRRKLASFYRKSQHEDEIKGSSSIPRSPDIRKSNVNASPRRVSAHERHYTVNKAASEDLKKKTFLPYKQGILGRLAVNPTVHALAHGFGSLPM